MIRNVLNSTNVLSQIALNRIELPWPQFENITSSQLAVVTGLLSAT